VEIERWDDANEKAWLHVKVPSVSDSADTETYLYYDSGHADNTTYVGDTTDAVTHNVWDANFVGVWHMAQDPDGDGADAIKDSTSNAYDATPVGSMVTADLVEGKVGKGIDFNGSSQLVSERSAGSETTLGTYTLEAIGKMDSGGDNQRLVSFQNYNDEDPHFFIRTESSNYAMVFGRGAGADSASSKTDNVDLNDADYHYIAGTINGSTGKVELFREGVSKGTTTTSQFTEKTIPSISIGASEYTGSGNVQNFDGIIDEVRISDTARSASWIKATYHTLWDSLITFGSEEYSQLACEPLIITSSISASPQLQIPITEALSAVLSLHMNSVFIGQFVVCDPLILAASLSANIQQQVSLSALELATSLSSSPQLQIPLTALELTSSMAITRVWDGTAWKEWIEANKHRLTILYYFTLTGEADGESALVIPISSWQSRRRSGSPTSLTVVIPGVALLSDILDRTNGTLQIEMVYLLDGVEQYREVVCEVDYERLRMDQGGRNQSITVSGHRTETFVNKTIDLQDVVYYSTDQGLMRFRCASVNMYLNPGDTALYQGEEIAVNQIVISVSAENNYVEQSMEVNEAEY